MASGDAQRPLVEQSRSTPLRFLSLSLRTYCRRVYLIHSVGEGAQWSQNNTFAFVKTFPGEWILFQVWHIPNRNVLAAAKNSVN